MPRSPLRLLALISLGVAACRCAPEPAPAPAPPPRAYVPKAKCPLPPDAAAKVGDEPANPDLRFEAAMRAFDAAWEAKRDDEALACAQEASRLAPDEPHPHLDRAMALDVLGATHEAHLAFGRAHALDPDNPEIVREFGDFLFRDGSGDALETAAALARRGREGAEDRSLGAELAALEAACLSALGRPAEALVAAETALALDEQQPEGHVERGVALFELLRFDDAAQALAAARGHAPEDARAHHFSGLVAERLGRADEAARHFADAARIDPDAFPLPLDVDPAAFQRIVDEERGALGEADVARLARAEFGWEEIPAMDDLQNGDPVLSPTIIGLFRPGEGGAKDAIVLYRRNLLRLCRTKEELHREVRDTLLHELGHLDGENDAELRDRGL